MSKKIDTLVTDIYSFLTSTHTSVSREELDKFGKSLADKLYSQFTRVQKFSLRVSNLGTPCRRKLWYSANKPETAEPINGSARLKFLFGDVIEELILLLARLSGHEVSDEQAEVSVGGVRGHIDAVVDGRLVDVKSASTPSYKKFKDHLAPETDGFGYLGQLGTYAHGRKTDVASFVVVDKTLGNVTLDTHVFQDKDYDKDIAEVRDILSQPTPPARHYDDKPFQESGNRQLGFECSYCAFKRECWPGLRRFAFARAPVDLTVVVREPQVPEIT